MKTLDQAQGITLLGLGPGDSRLLTREALDWLESIHEIYLRTEQHPVVKSLPEHLIIISGDEYYEEFAAFEDVYEAIIMTVLELGKRPAGVTYAVPGDPFVAEETCPEIYKRAQDQGLPVRVIHGLSFLEPTFKALEIDPFPDLVLADAMRMSMRQTPGFSPTKPTLIAQIYSRMMASDVKLTLMSVYPDSHPVKLVHGAGTDEVQVESLPLHSIDQSPHLGLLSSLFVPPLSVHSSFESFQEIIARLRAPDGCPWDREQTHLSLRPFLLEETYETLDALDHVDMAALKEELGDLLLQVFLHAQIASEDGDFTIHDVLEGIGEKLIRRHPHVFSRVQVEGVPGVIRNWESIKAEERRERHDESKNGKLDGVPNALPALSQAQAVIDRVKRDEVDVLDQEGDPDKIIRRINAFQDHEAEERDTLFGELLLSLSVFGYKQGMDAESLLRETLARFRNRYSIMEALAEKMGAPIVSLTPEEKADLWQQAGYNKGKNL